MRILIACEYSGTVRDAFLAKGHDAMSCDLLPTDVPGPHYQGDVRHIINEKWDMVIGHPPCTRLTNSVYWYILKHNLQDEVREAAAFFNLILNCNARMVCVENPVMNPEAKKYIRKQDQLIQPYQFGENASKATCLWLRGLPLLQPTGYAPPRLVNGKKRWGNQTDGGWNNLPPSKDRWKIRSKTYPGIAEAMADQFLKRYE
jgi:hypothetical protein